MAEEQNSQDKTEAATPRRRDDARGRGQVAVSADMTQAAMLLTAATMLWFTASRVAGTVLTVMRREFYVLGHPDWSIGHTVVMVRAIAGHVGAALLPLMFAMMIMAVAVTAGQIGIRISTESLTLNWSRLSVTQGWSRLFSLRSTMRGVMMLLKMSLGLGVVTWFLWANRQWIADLGRQSLEPTIVATWTAGLWLAFVLGGMLLVIGAFDYLFQRWQLEQDLRMSRHDVQEEHKREDGNPLVKGRRKRLVRESLKLRMLRNVPDATVVLTNPTHIACALQYDRDQMGAPRLVAKGTDAFAKRIVALANEHGIPVIERKPLARAIYASVEVNQDIPPNLYRAVAEILAQLYDLRRRA